MLYRGFLPSIMTSVPSSSLGWLFYSVYKRHLEALCRRVGLLSNAAHSGSTSDAPKAIINAPLMITYATAGACSGFSTGCIVSPLDLIKTRIQTSPPGTTIRQTVRDLVRQEGTFGLFTKGLPAKLLGSVPVSASSHLLYSVVRRTADLFVDRPCWLASTSSERCSAPPTPKTRFLLLNSYIVQHN